MTLKMDWKTFVFGLILLWFTHRNEAAAVFADVKKNGEPVMNSRRADFISQKVDNELQQFADDVLYNNHERIIVNGRRRVLS